MKLLTLPMLISLAALIFTKNIPINTDVAVTGVPNDTPRIKHFARVEVIKTTGTVQGAAIDKVGLFIINGAKYEAPTELGKFKHTTLKADEMIITPANDKKAIQLYGTIAGKGVVEFRNAMIVAPMAVLNNKKPLFAFIVDGKLLITVDGESKGGTSMAESINPNRLQEIIILKDTAGMAKYGNKAKNGVVEIKTSMMEHGVEYGPMDDGIPELMDRKTVSPQPVATDTNMVFEKVEIDAAFDGGDAAWRKHLERNLNRLIPSDNNAPQGTYTVWVRFIVDKQGFISEVRALSNHGYGMEQEAVRVIRTTNGRWISPVQNGRKVKAFKSQPITFVVEE